MFMKMKAIGISIFLWLFASTGQADVRHMDVWNAMKSYYTALGYQVEARQTQQGDRLKIQDFSLSMTNNGGEIQLKFSDFSFNEQSDGRVKITVPPQPKLVINNTTPLGKTFSYSAQFNIQNVEIYASGTPENISFHSSMGELSAVISPLITQNMPQAGEHFEVKFTGQKVVGKTRLSSANNDELSTSQDLAIGVLNYEALITAHQGAADEEYEAGEKIHLQGQIENIDITNVSVLPKQKAPSKDMAALMRAGMSGEGTITFQRNQNALKIDGPDGVGHITQASSGGLVSLSMNKKGLSYDIAQTDQQITIQAADQPEAEQINIERTKISLKLPVQKSQTPQDFGVHVALEAFTLPETLWGMFVPKGALSKEAITIEFDISGKMKISSGLFEPIESEDAAVQMRLPGQLHSLSLNKLWLQVLSAQLSGQGQLHFDQTNQQDLETFPMPEGVISLTLKGADSFLEQLVQNGTLSSEQALGARMMMGVLSLQSDEPNTVKSKIEFTKQGRIFANGQRIR